MKSDEDAARLQEQLRAFVAKTKDWTLRDFQNHLRESIDQMTDERWAKLTKAQRAQFKRGVAYIVSWKE
jgi:hypothetical protein